MPSRAPADFDRTRSDHLLVRGVPPTEGRIAERSAWFEPRAFATQRQAGPLPQPVEAPQLS